MLEQRSKLLKNVFISIILLASLVGILLRSTELLSQNYLFGFDQGRDYLAVYDIVEKNDFRLIGSEFGAGSAGFSGLFHGPFHYYFLSVAYLIFKGDPYGGMVLMYLFSIGTVGLGFVLGKKLFGTFYGLCLMTLIAISPPLISTGRIIWNSHPAPFFVMLVFLSVYYLVRGRKEAVFFAAFFSAFIYNFQTAIAVPLVVSLFLFLTVVLRVRSFKIYIQAVIGVVLAVLPFILFEIRNHFIGIHGLLEYLFYREEPFYISSHDRSEIFSRMFDHFGSFMYNYSSTFSHSNILPFFFLLLAILIPFIILLRKEKDGIVKKTYLYFLIVPCVTFCIFLFLRNTVYGYYLLSLNLVYILFFVYVLRKSVKKSGKVLVVYSLFFLSLCIASVVSNINIFRNDFVDYGGDAKIKGKIDAIDYIYKDANGEEFGLLVFSPPVYTYPYDYILKWYAEEKYGYIPHSRKEGIFYLLIEVDSKKPWSYEGWLETVIVDGTVEKTTELDSGFIVQKRYEE